MTELEIIKCPICGKDAIIEREIGDAEKETGRCTVCDWKS